MGKLQLRLAKTGERFESVSPKRIMKPCLRPHHLPPTPTAAAQVCMAPASGPTHMLTTKLDLGVQKLLELVCAGGEPIIVFNLVI